MNDIEELIEKIIKFRDARDWKQFHKPKDLAISLALEAAEVLELFQWKKEEEIEEFIKTNKERLGEELVDVFYWILLLAHDAGIDLKQAFERKMEINDKKYPVGKAKGKKEKYNEL